MAKWVAHWPMARPSIAAAITVASGTFGTYALIYMNLSRYSDKGSSSHLIQFSKSLVVFVPG